jgi:hypothetical protein
MMAIAPPGGNRMNERLYRFRPDQAVFETGTAQGKQLLLANNYGLQEILLHWFAADGEFLELERVPIPPGPIQITVRDKPELHAQVVWLRSYKEKVEHQLAELKERIGFVPGEIAVRKFQSDEAGIQDLPGEYEEFLMKRDDYSEEDQRYFDGYIREFRNRNCFVLEFCEQYWMSADGEVEHS